MQRIVGKNVLESLTTGMYSDSRIIFREYIQNSTDAIDNAIKSKLLGKDEGSVEIKINARKREISLRDNGIGIPSAEVYNKLGDIGKSEKDFKEQRGFRGIGRLGGLGYCDELTFITSYYGENKKTITVWDCVQLRNLLLPNVEKNLDVIELVNRVTEDSTELEDKDEHYFEVILTGIRKENEYLLDKDEIKNYLSQVAPVPYNCQMFADLKKINEKLLALSKTPEEYKIVLNSETIYKPYRRSVLAGNKKEKDYIQEIEFFEDKKSNGELLFLGWYGLTNLTGQIKEDDINGIRLRKHNIQIGDNHSLDSFFGNNPSYQRLNRWYVGEIFVFDDDIIPNARRDNFEQNTAYKYFCEKVENTTRDILCKLPYQSSQERSDNKIIKNTEKELNTISKEIDDGVTANSKVRLFDKLEKQERDVKRVITRIEKSEEDEGTSKTKEKVVKKLKGTVLKEIEKLKEKVETTRNYKLNKIPTSYSKEVRNVLKIVFEVIDTHLPEGQAQELQDRIIEELKKQGKAK
jgi:molecular chaperone HtpG